MKAKDGNSRFRISFRIVLTALCFYGTFNLYAMRMNLSVGILCMVNHTATRPDAHSSSLEYNTTLHINRSIADPCSARLSGDVQRYRDGEFSWSKQTRGLILGMFFWGYLLSQIPVGLIAQHYSVKTILIVSNAVCALCLLLTPVLARRHLYLFLTTRMLIGLASGTWFPCFTQLWARWAPINERSRLVGIAYAGVHIGNAVTLPAAGYLCVNGFDGGWPSLFYIVGIMVTVWIVLFALLTADSPRQHRFINVSEQKLIEHNLNFNANANQEDAKNILESIKRIPFKSICKSMPVWAILISNVTFDWNAYLFQTCIPTYMKEILKFDLNSNSLLSALPYLGLWLGQTIGAICADRMIKSKIKVFSITFVRKFLHTLSCLVPAMMALILCFITCEYSYLAVGLLTFGLAMNGLFFVSTLLNIVDMAPQYSGFILSITNSIGALTGFIAPYFVHVVTSNGNILEWRIVFYVCIGVYLFGAIFYLIFASAEVQPWAIKENPNTIPISMNKQKNNLLIEPMSKQEIIDN